LDSLGSSDAFYLAFHLSEHEEAVVGGILEQVP
jgi:hypothetical protein